MKRSLTPGLYLLYGFRSLLFYCGYVVSALLYAPLVLLIGVFLSFDKRCQCINLWSQFVLFWLRITCKINVNVVKSDVHNQHPQLRHLANTSSIILSNHQSSWEALFLQLHFQPCVTVVKKELLMIPFFGWGLRMLNPIAIDRNRPRIAGKQFIQQSKRAVSEGKNILLFPEGTRVAPGHVGAFNLGGFRLAAATQTQVVTVLHNAGEFWPARRFMKFPGCIQCSIGIPLKITGTPQSAADQFKQDLTGFLKAHVT